MVEYHLHICGAEWESFRIYAEQLSLRMACQIIQKQDSIAILSCLPHIKCHEVFYPGMRYHLDISKVSTPHT
jgi:hypothetical protein